MLVIILRVILSALFLFSGIVKLFDLRKFSITVAQYGMLPRQLVKPFAYTLPVVETLIGLWLSSAWNIFWAAIAGLALLLISEFGVFVALLQKKKMENCGCFGTAIKVPLTWRKFFENLVWIAIALVLVWRMWA